MNCYNQLHLSSIRDVGIVRPYTVPQMSRQNVARKLRRRYRPPLSLWSVSIRTAQDRRHHDLHLRSETIGYHAAPARHEDLPLLRHDRPQVPPRDHDGGRGQSHRLEQQRNSRIIDCITGEGLDTARQRTARHRGRVRMADHYRCGDVLQTTQLTGRMT